MDAVGNVNCINKGAFMQRYTYIFIILVAVLFALFAPILMLTSLGHEHENCSNEHCTICILKQQLNNLIKQLALCSFVATILMRGATRVLCVLGCLGRTENFDTQITLRVQSNC